MASPHMRSVDLDLLHPVVRDKVKTVQAALAAKGLPLQVFEAFRSPERQALLFAKKPPVTRAPPWRSYHQYGLAVDFVLFVNGSWSWDTGPQFAKAWDELHEIGRAHGLEPLSFEKPHLQLAGIHIADLAAGRFPPGGDESWASNLEGVIAAWRGLPSAPPPPVVGNEARPPAPPVLSPTGRIALPDQAETTFGEALDRLFPNARPDVLEAVRRNAPAVLEEFEIAQTDDRLAFFLAQIANETGGLRLVEERLSYTPQRLMEVWPKRFPTRELAERFARNPERLANNIYANRLGNGPPESGDGFRYRGLGLIQLTGRSNYARVGQEIGLPLEANPALAIAPEHMLRVACGYWRANRLNSFADRGDFDGLCRRVNGGDIGLTERRRWLKRIREVFHGVGAAAALDTTDTSSPVEGPAMDQDGPITEELSLGDRGERVKALQQALKAKNYHVGAVDGIFGRLTQAAVLAFQAANNLPTTGRVGNDSWAVLDSAGGRPLDPERTNADANTLRERKSDTVLNADRTKLAGVVSGLIGVLGLLNSLITGAPVAGQGAAATAAQGTTCPQLATRPAAELSQMLAQSPDAIIACLRRTQTAIDALFGPNSSLSGLSELIGTLVPGAGGSALAIGIGVAAHIFGQRIIDRRVADHRDAANQNR